MQGTALIVQVENTVMMVLVGRSNAMRMPMRMTCHGRRFEYVERMVVDQRNDPATCAATNKPSKQA